MFNLILGKSDVKKRFLSVNFKTFTAEVEQKEEFRINSKKLKLKDYLRLKKIIKKHFLEEFLLLGFELAKTLKFSTIFNHLSRTIE